MVICLSRVLTGDECVRIARRLGGKRFVDGRRTAGWHARGVKRNAQIPAGVAKRDAALVGAALARHEVFAAAARPLHLSAILFNRYDVGMAYGAHVDDAIMPRGDGESLRTDLSFTVFLADPATYDGGDLVIADAGGERAYRLAAGDALLYPATTLHRVEPVTRGARLAAVGWVQSLVAEAAAREILFDLDLARRSIFAAHGKTDAFDLIAKAHANLLRRWSAV